jgi:hypothetical protein
VAPPLHLEQRKIEEGEQRIEDAAAGQGVPGPGAGPLRAGDHVQLPPAPTLPDPPPSRHHRHRLREPQQARMGTPHGPGKKLPAARSREVS